MMLSNSGSIMPGSRQQLSSSAMIMGTSTACHDENTVASIHSITKKANPSSKSVISKTPAGKDMGVSTQRRAFGDISNRKVFNNANTNNNNTNATVATTQKAVSFAKTPATSKKTLSTKPLQASAAKNQLLPSARKSSHKENLRLSLKKSLTKNVNTKHLNNKSELSSSFILDESMNDRDACDDDDDDSVESIELPAGRMWEEEQALHGYWDVNYEEECSLEGAFTAREDLLAALEEHQELERQWDTEDAQKCSDELDKFVAGEIARDEDSSVMKPFDLAEELNDLDLLDNILNSDLSVGPFPSTTLIDISF